MERRSARVRGRQQFSNVVFSVLSFLILTMKGNKTNPNSAYKSFAACCSFSPVVGTKRVVTSGKWPDFVPGQTRDCLLVDPS